MSCGDIRAGGHGGSTEVPGMKHVALPIALAGFVMSVPAGAEEAQSFSKDQIATGAELYAVNCSPCHGARMQEPGAAFNLRKFPPDQRERFVNSVTRGKNQMPPWGDFFKPEQLEALWAYVMAGER
jgi:mono/diheme cytochrome c family protein